MTKLLDKLKQQIIDEEGNFPIYLDNQSTTPMDPRVLDAMLPYFIGKFGNPHSITHALGHEAEAVCELARKQVASLIGAYPQEIIFTSGATESNNTAIKGIAKFYGKKKKHIITLPTEHKCVLETCKYLELNNFRVTYLPVEPNGLISLERLENTISTDTILVSVMAVNNEIGVIQPLKEIGAICRKKNVLFHSDIAQGFGKIPIDVNECNIDLASISGHKIYGPKGIGALYIRSMPKVMLPPLIHGGGQEGGIRSGTLPTPLVAGFGVAAAIAESEMQKDYNHIKSLFTNFLDIIESETKGVYLNGDRYMRYPGNINLSFACIESESMIMSVKELAVSSGSACTSGSPEPSYVLTSLGIPDILAHTAVRFGFGRFNTEHEIEYAARLVLSRIDKLRRLTPLCKIIE